MSHQARIKSELTRGKTLAAIIEGILFAIGWPVASVEAAFAIGSETGSEPAHRSPTAHRSGRPSPLSLSSSFY